MFTGFCLAIARRVRNGLRDRDVRRARDVDAIRRLRHHAAIGFRRTGLVREVADLHDTRRDRCGDLDDDGQHEVAARRDRESAPGHDATGRDAAVVGRHEHDVRIERIGDTVVRRVAAARVRERDHVGQHFARFGDAVARRIRNGLRDRDIGRARDVCAVRRLRHDAAIGVRRAGLERDVADFGDAVRNRIGDGHDHGQHEVAGRGNREAGPGHDATGRDAAVVGRHEHDVRIERIGDTVVRRVAAARVRERDHVGQHFARFGDAVARRIRNGLRDRDIGRARDVCAVRRLRHDAAIGVRRAGLERDVADFGDAVRNRIVDRDDHGQHEVAARRDREAVPGHDARCEYAAVVRTHERHVRIERIGDGIIQRVAAARVRERDRVGELFARLGLAVARRIGDRLRDRDIRLGGKIHATGRLRHHAAIGHDAAGFVRDVADFGDARRNRIDDLDDHGQREGAVARYAESGPLDVAAVQHAAVVRADERDIRVEYVGHRIRRRIRATRVGQGDRVRELFAGLGLARDCAAFSGQRLDDRDISGRRYRTAGHHLWQAIGGFMARRQNEARQLIIWVERIIGCVDYAQTVVAECADDIHASVRSPSYVTAVATGWADVLFAGHDITDRGRSLDTVAIQRARAVDASQVQIVARRREIRRVQVRAASGRRGRPGEPLVRDTAGRVEVQHTQLAGARILSRGLRNQVQLRIEVQRAVAIPVIGRKGADCHSDRSDIVERVREQFRRIVGVGQHPESGSVRIGHRGQRLGRGSRRAEVDVLLADHDIAEAAIEAHVHHRIPELAVRRGADVRIGRDHEIHARVADRRERGHGLGRGRIAEQAGAVRHRILVAVVDHLSVRPEQQVAGRVGDHRAAFVRDDRLRIDQRGRGGAGHAEVDDAALAVVPPAFGRAYFGRGARLEWLMDHGHVDAVRGYRAHAAIGRRGAGFVGDVADLGDAERQRIIDQHVDIQYEAAAGRNGEAAPFDVRADQRSAVVCTEEAHVRIERIGDCVAGRRAAAGVGERDRVAQRFAGFGDTGHAATFGCERLGDRHVGRGRQDRACAADRRARGRRGPGFMCDVRDLGDAVRNRIEDRDHHGQHEVAAGRDGQTAPGHNTRRMHAAVVGGHEHDVRVERIGDAVVQRVAAAGVRQRDRVRQRFARVGLTVTRRVGHGLRDRDIRCRRQVRAVRRLRRHAAIGFRRAGFVCEVADFGDTGRNRIDDLGNGGQHEIAAGRHGQAAPGHDAARLGAAVVGGHEYDIRVERIGDAVVQRVAAARVGQRDRVRQHLARFRLAIARCVGHGLRDRHIGHGRNHAAVRRRRRHAAIRRCATGFVCEVADCGDTVRDRRIDLHGHRKHEVAPRGHRESAPGHDTTCLGAAVVGRHERDVRVERVGDAVVRCIAAAGVRESDRVSELFAGFGDTGHRTTLGHQRLREGNRRNRLGRRLGTVRRQRRHRAIGWRGTGFVRDIADFGDAERNRIDHFADHGQGQ